MADVVMENSDADYLLPPSKLERIRNALRRRVGLPPKLRFGDAANSGLDFQEFVQCIEGDAVTFKKFLKELREPHSVDPQLLERVEAAFREQREKRTLQAPMPDAADAAADVAADDDGAARGDGSKATTGLPLMKIVPGQRLQPAHQVLQVSPARVGPNPPGSQLVTDGGQLTSPLDTLLATHTLAKLPPLQRAEATCDDDGAASAASDAVTSTAPSATPEWK